MKYESKSFKIITTVGAFIMRTVTLPFWAIITGLGFGYQWLCACTLFWFYGGEVVAYGRKNSRKMMNDVYAYAKQKLDEKQYIDSLPEDINQPLFNYFSRVHKLTLLESEIQDIIEHAKSL